MKKQKVRNAHVILTVIISCITVIFMLAVSLFLAVENLGLRICTVQGVSMEPTFYEGTRLLLQPKEAERFDIMVFQIDGKYIIKRVIGLPGDEVAVRDGKLFVNGVLYKEPYLSEENIRLFEQTDFEIQVSEGEYFVMGDNRDHSADSRKTGLVDSGQVVGIAILVLK